MLPVKRWLATSLLALPVLVIIRRITRQPIILMKMLASLMGCTPAKCQGARLSASRLKAH